MAERWPIPPEARAELVTVLRDVVAQTSDDKTKVLAGRVLLQADALNLAAEKAEADRQYAEQLAALQAEVDALRGADSPVVVQGESAAG
jgi:hypothetical protein